MLPGHNYFIGGGKGNDGLLRIWLLDQTYTPSGYYNDVVADPPKESKTQTKFWLIRSKWYSDPALSDQWIRKHPAKRSWIIRAKPGASLLNIKAGLIFVKKK